MFLQVIILLQPCINITVEYMATLLQLFLAFREARVKQLARCAISWLESAAASSRHRVSVAAGASPAVVFQKGSTLPESRNFGPER
jgi:hypothetical protein